MAIGGNRYLRYITISCITVVLPILLKISNVHYLFHKYLGFDDISIILLKVFMDICVLLCFMLCLFWINKKRKCFFLIAPFIVLKCLDIFVFVIGATLFLKYGTAQNIFEDTSMILVLAVILYIGYWSSVLFLYVFVTFYKTNLFGRCECGETDCLKKTQHPIIDVI